MVDKQSFLAEIVLAIALPTGKKVTMYSSLEFS